MSRYIIWSPSAYQPPTKTFTSESEAQRVAEIMATKHAPSIFHVCKIMGTAKCITSTYEKAK